MLKNRNFPVKSDIKKESRGRKDFLLPIFCGVIFFFGSQKFFGMRIICTGDHDVGLENSCFGVNAFGFSTFGFDFCDFLIHIKFNAEFFGQSDPSQGNCIKSTFRIPSPQTEICMVHKVIEGRRILGFCA